MHEQGGKSLDSAGEAVTWKLKTKATQALGWNVPPGTSSAPTAKFLYRLSAPLRWWKVSIVRIVAREPYNLVLRIREYLRDPLLSFGFPIAAPDYEGSLRETFDAENEFLRSCSEDMRHLQQTNRWAANLELKMAAQAYLLGAKVALRNPCKSEHSE